MSLLETVEPLAVSNQPGQFTDQILIEKRAKGRQGSLLVLLVKRDYFPPAAALVVPFLQNYRNRPGIQFHKLLFV